jgi:hypothetical protein
MFGNLCNSDADSDTPNILRQLILVVLGSILDRDLKSLNKKTKHTQWPEFASELYRPSDRRLSAKLVQIVADRAVSRS